MEGWPSGRRDKPARRPGRTRRPMSLRARQALVCRVGWSAHGGTEQAGAGVTSCAGLGRCIQSFLPLIPDRAGQRLGPCWIGANGSCVGLAVDGTQWHAGKRVALAVRHASQAGAGGQRMGPAKLAGASRSWQAAADWQIGDGSPHGKPRLQPHTCEMYSCRTPEPRHARSGGLTDSLSLQPLAEPAGASRKGPMVRTLRISATPPPQTSNRPIPALTLDTTRW